MRRYIAVLLMLLGLLAVSVQAAETGEIAQSIQGLDELQQAGEQWLPDVELSEGISLDEGVRSILDTGSSEVFGVLRKGLRSGVLLLVVVMLCGVTEGLSDSAGAARTVDVVTITGALAVTAVAVTDVHSLIGMGRGALEGMATFSKLLLPVVTAAAAASGTPSSAAARQLATMLFSDVLITLITKLLLPLVYLYIAACVGYAAVGNEGLKRIGATLKWAVTGVLSGVLTLFVTYLAVSGAVAGAADATTVKAAKMTMSSMIPVVGGILSDAAETVLAGAGILKNAVGIFGMLVILAMCIVPFLQLGIHYLSYKLAAALSATVSGGRVTGLIDQISGAFGLVLGMTGATALLLLISMVSAIQATAG